MEAPECEASVYNLCNIFISYFIMQLYFVIVKWLSLYNTVPQASLETRVSLPSTRCPASSQSRALIFRMSSAIAFLFSNLEYL
jgi:hypothetical protein